MVCPVVCPVAVCVCCTGLSVVVVMLTRIVLYCIEIYMSHTEWANVSFEG